MIYLDSCLLIYAIEKDAVFGDKVIDAIDSAEDEEFAISPLVKLECLVKPLETGNTGLKKYYEAAFDNLSTIEINEEVYLDAALLRSKFKIRTADALHLSCAQFHQCSALWTNDNRLVNAAHGLAVNICSQKAK